jgi:hypothetical protein
MILEELPPSEFVLAHYDDIHTPGGGIEEYIGGWVCRTRNAEVRSRNEPIWAGYATPKPLTWLSPSRLLDPRVG